MRILFVILLLVSGSGFCQEKKYLGYLGYKNSIQISTRLHPFVRDIQSVNTDITEAKKTKAFLNGLIGVKYAHVLTDKIQLSAGYEFTRSHVDAGIFNHYWIEIETEDLAGQPLIYEKEYNLLADMPLYFNNYFFEFNYYRVGTKAPTGKFLTLGTSLGFASAKSPEIIGKRHLNTTDNFFIKKAPIIEHYDFSQVNPIEYKIKRLQFFGRIGRSYPISQRLIFNIGLTMPIISVYFWNGGFEGGTNYSNLASMGGRDRVVFSIRRLDMGSADFGLQFVF